MPILALLMFAQDHQDHAVSAAEAMAIHRERSRADVPCRTTGDSDEIVVCARRDADHYRVPLATPYNGKDTDAGRLEQAFAGADGQLPCGQGAFTVRCGSVGVSVGVSRRGVRYVRRELAP